MQNPLKLTPREEHSDNELLLNEAAKRSSSLHLTTIPNNTEEHGCHEAPLGLHYAETRRQTPKSSSTRQIKIVKPPPRSPRYHTQNIRDANIASTNDANHLMLHSAKKYVKTPNSYRTSNQRFSSLRIDTPNKTENANIANTDESPFELTKTTC
jgi:hypothetical protein